MASKANFPIKALNRQPRKPSVRAALVINSELSLSSSASSSLLSSNSEQNTPTSKKGGHPSLSELNLPPGTVVSPRSFKILSEKDNSSPVQPSYPNQQSASTNNEINVDSPNQPFILKQLIAEGTYGAVYRAEKCKLKNNINLDSSGRVGPEHLDKTGDEIAVKILTLQDGIKSSVGSISEIDIMARFRHPNLMSLLSISVVDFVTPMKTTDKEHPKTTVAISMPLGLSDVSHYIERNHLSFEDNVYIIWQILQGLNYLHRQQVLHLDLKLENVLVIDNRLRVLITDFGLTLYCDRNGRRQSNRQLVTITYRAPELFTRPGYYDTKVDIWSVGMCFFYLLLRLKHIFKKIKPEKIVYQAIADIFSNQKQRTTLQAYLKSITATNQQKDLAINFLARILQLNPQLRPSAEDLLNDPLFTVLLQPRRIKLGSLIDGTVLYPLIWIYPAEEIGIEPYLALNFLIRLIQSKNPLVETYFIAADFFHRSLANLYYLKDYFHQLRLCSWVDGCSLTEIISLGALTSYLIALKCNEDPNICSEDMMRLSGGHFTIYHIDEMERQLLVGLQGVVYRWNPFRDALTKQDLINGFHLTTNIFQYPYETMKRNIVGANPGNNDLHYIRFLDIFRLTQYHRDQLHLTNEQLANSYYQRDRQIYFSQRHKTIITLEG